MSLCKRNNKSSQPTVKHILITVDGRTEAEAKKLVEEVVAKIKAGTSFADLATQYSEDPASKAKGGEIAVYQKGVFGDAFDQTVASLKAGQVSAPVKTDYGYHLIETASTAIQVPSLETEKARLAEEILKTKNANVFSDTINRINDMVVSSDALDVISQEVKDAKIQSVNGLTLSSIHPVLSDANVKVKLFNDDVKNGERNVSSNIQLANGDVIWVKVRNYHPAGVQTLAEAKAKVTAKLIEQKAVEVAKAKIQNTLNEFKSKPAVSVNKTGLNFVATGTFTRADGMLKREIQRLAFSLVAPKEGFWSVTTANLPNELVVVAVTNVNKTTSSALTDDQLAELSKLYQQLRGQQEFDDYTRYLKEQAKIK